MKKQINIFFAILCCLHASSQNEEFSKSGNGLIYSDATIGQLKFIVDSLNLKHKICELNKIYQAKSQAKAHFVSVQKINVKEARQDITAGISFEDFMVKYPKATIERELLVVKYRYKNDDGKDAISFRSVELDNKFDHALQFDKQISYYEGPLKGKWIINYSSKTA